MFYTEFENDFVQLETNILNRSLCTVCMYEGESTKLSLEIGSTVNKHEQILK